MSNIVTAQDIELGITSQQQHKENIPNQILEQQQIPLKEHSSKLGQNTLDKNHHKLDPSNTKNHNAKYDNANVHTKYRSPIEQANCLKYLNFAYSIPIFKMINKQKGLLTTDDLPELGQSEKIDEYSQTILNEYAKCKKVMLSKATLVKPIFNTFKKSLLTMYLLQLFWTGFRLSYAIFFNKLILVLNKPNPSLNEIFQWAGLLFAAVIMASYSGHHVYNLSSMISIKMKQSLVAIIYMKVNKLSSYALNKVSIGKIVNLAANDLNVLERGIHFIGAIILVPFTLCAGIAILWNLFGAPCLVSIGYMFLVIPIQVLISKSSIHPRKQKNIATDERIKLTNEILDGIRLLKMYTWDMAFQQTIQEKRNKEVKYLGTIAFYEGLARGIANSSIFLTIFLVVFAYILTTGSITASQVFPMIILVQIFRQMCIYFVMLGFNSIAESKLVLERIKNLLDVDEISLKQFPNTLDSQNAIELKNFCGYWCDESLQKTDLKIKETTLIKKSQETQDNLLVDNAGTKLTLVHLTMNIKKNTLVGIIGRIGCCKSTLLLSMMNELPTITGILSLNGTIAYVEQEPIIFPGILRESILFGKEYEPEWYAKVIEACCLLDDLKTFKSWDMTEIGEKGINLSGGQKARVALARAIYSKSDIYLLDDPLSAVDTKVAKILFEKAIKELLKVKQFCWLLIKYILQKNVLKLLLCMKVGLYAMSQNLDLENIFQEKIINKRNQIIDPIEKKNLLQENSINEDKENIEMDEEERAIAEDKGKLFSKEDIYSGLVTKHTWIQYLKACCNSLLAILILIVYSAYEVNNIMFLRTLGWLSIRDLNNNQGLYILGGITGSCIIIAVGKYMLFNYTTLRGAEKLHNQMIKRIVRNPVQFFDTNPVGRILNRFSNDVGVLDRGLPSTLSDTLDGFFLYTVIFITIWIINPFVLIPGAVACIFYYVVLRFCSKSIIEIRSAELISRSPLYSLLSLTLNGVITIRAYRQSNPFIKKFVALCNENAKGLYYFQYCSRFFGFAVDGISILISIAGISIIVTTNQTDQGLVALSASFLLTLTDNMQWVLRQFIATDQQMASTARILRYTETHNEAELILPNDNKLMGWPNEGSIQFNQVYMKYHEDMDYAVKNLTFNVISGEKIGCIGRTGAGKSSIIQLLFRMIEIDKEISPDSYVKIDGIDALCIGLHTLRDKISIIPQTPFVFTGTIRRNLDPFSKINEIELWKVLEEVNLRKYIETLPDKLDIDMTNAASIFSVGQKQLICLARAILKKNKIIVLNEATANVDLETDNFIQKKIMEKFDECTIFTIAHRLSTIAHYDKVIVMDKGTLIEYDIPFRLLANNEDDDKITKDSYFASMVLNTGPKTSKSIFEKCKRSYLKKVRKIRENVVKLNV